MSGICDLQWIRLPTHYIKPASTMIEPPPTAKSLATARAAAPEAVLLAMVALVVPVPDHVAAAPLTLEAVNILKAVLAAAPNSKVGVLGNIGIVVVDVLALAAPSVVWGDPSEAELGRVDSAGSLVGSEVGEPYAVNEASARPVPRGIASI